MIIQTNTFICEKCHKTTSYTSEVDFYSDPVVGIPVGGEEYDYKMVDGKELLLCSDCVKKHVKE
jgi:hypothetical protein